MLSIKNWSKEHFDEYFAYDTVKLVRVQDRRLGICYYLFLSVITVYVLLYVFGVSQKYLAEEKVQGWVLIQMRNRQFDDSEPPLPWDLYDRWTNPGEVGAVFIPTRVLITRGQTQDVPGQEFCESPLHLCSVPEDCVEEVHDENLQKAECVNGHCMRRQWCPAEDPAVATTETHYLEFEAVELRFQTYTHFHSFSMYMSTSDEKEWIPYPNERANTYRLEDLVGWMGAEPSAILENGAVMMVNLMMDSPWAWWWEERTVRQKLESHSIDTRTGYNFVHNEYYYEEGVAKRDTYRMFGLRVMAHATGFAEKVSDSGIVLQLASAFSLMACAEWFTDIVLTYFLPERNHYASFRVKQTEDFNPDSPSRS